MKPYQLNFASTSESKGVPLIKVDDTTLLAKNPSGAYF